MALAEPVRRKRNGVPLMAYGPPDLAAAIARTAEQRLVSVSDILRQCAAATLIEDGAYTPPDRR
jgi:hypothetical protein